MLQYPIGSSFYSMRTANSRKEYRLPTLAKDHSEISYSNKTAPDLELSSPNSNSFVSFRWVHYIQDGKERMIKLHFI